MAGRLPPTPQAICPGQKVNMTEGDYEVSSAERRSRVVSTIVHWGGSVAFCPEEGRGLAVQLREENRTCAKFLHCSAPFLQERTGTA